MWIEAVSVHQEFCATHFMICERHFMSDDFATKPKKSLCNVPKKCLKKGAIPSVFDKEPVDMERPETSFTSKKGKSVMRRYCKIKSCHMTRNSG